MSRFMSRSLLRADMVSILPGSAADPKHIDDEDQRGSTRDVGRRTLVAVPELRRDDEHDPAAGLHAHEPLDPAVDEAALGQRERRRLPAVGLVERLVGAPDLAEVVDGDGGVLLDRRTVTLDEQDLVEP